MLSKERINKPVINDEDVGTPSNAPLNDLAIINDSTCFERKEMCGCCNLCKPNGAFIHRKTAHQIYCYNCSQLWKRKKESKCPACNRPIDRVVKLFGIYYT